MKIYNPNNQLIIDVAVDDASYRLREIMGSNNLELRYALPEFVAIPAGSYCDFETERYWMPRGVEYVKEHSQKFTYTLSLEGSIGFMKSTKFKFFDYVLNNGLIKPTSSFKLKFPITATPRMIADLLIANLRLKYPQYPWAVGSCIESEPVVMDFNHDFCYDVLPKLVKDFNTEWELDKFTLNIGKVEKMKDSAVDLSYGYNNGILGGISRLRYDDTRIINRVYIEAGDRNIDRSTYGSDTLLLSKNKLITHQGIEYKTDASGSYLERSTPLAGDDDSLDVSKFYPKRIGVVSGVEKINDAEGLYNIIDSSIPADLDYSKLIIAGETMTIIFQTGQLAGKEFDVVYVHNLRKFYLKPINPNGLIYPKGNIIPAIGDKYVVFHMRMPASYITDAENDALQETVKYLWQNEQPQYSYRWLLDSIYAKRNWGAIRGFLNCGYFVRFSDPQFLPEAVDVRIVAVKEPVNDPKSPEITIANNVTSRELGSVLNEIPTVEQAVDRKDRDIVDFTKRRFRDVQETITMLEDAQLNFSESVNPITVQTMLALIGDNTLQFRFVNNKVTPSRVPFLVTYNSTNKTLSAPAGILQHMTIGIASISSSHKASEYKFWDMASYVSGVLSDAKAKYYLYAKVEKAGSKGTFLISEQAIAFEAVTGYYHLLVGVLNSELDGERSYVDLYGYTEILPGRITTDRIVSSDGNNFMDFVANAFKIGDNTRHLAWNVINGLLEILNASLQIKNSAGQIVSEINGDTGAATFGKGAHKFNPDGSLDLANNNFLYDLINGLKITGKFESNKDGVRLILDPVARALIMKDAADNEIATLNIETSSALGSRSSLKLKNTTAGRESSLSIYPEGLTTYAPISQRSAGLYSRTGAWSQPYLFVGNDGDNSPVNEVNNARFAAYLSGETLILFANNLPTSPQNLRKGQVWNDNGLLRVVQ